MTTQGGPEVLKVSYVQTYARTHRCPVKRIYISKTLIGFPKTSIIASYLVHYMKYKVMIFLFGYI